MADMLVPVSMALITVYDAEYLGMTKTTQCADKRGPADD